MRIVAPTLVVGLLLLVPSAVFAQASITGVVRDTSGAVLPGVTVEASSPDLIEKVRTALTDESGRYRIVDLRTGTYAVTFTLTGFSPVRRDGIVLTGTFTATVDAELRVGSLQETVTVTGESPIVDVQSIRRQTVLDNETISSIPASRSYTSLMQLMPNTVTASGAATDVQVVPGMVVFGGAGGRNNEGRLNIDGISVGSAFNGAGVSSYIADIGNSREIVMTTSGGLGEAENGGPSLNVVPKEGGNSIKGSMYASGVTSGMVNSNYTDELKARGLTVPGELRKVWDFNLGVGGPIKQDRLWYYGTVRDEGSERGVAGMFANKNAGDPTKWTYEADTTKPAILAASYRIATLRLTSQLTQKNKVAVYWDEQRPCEGGAAPGFDGNACRKSGSDGIYAGSTAPPTPSASATLAPETAAYRDYGVRVYQAKWTAPITNRLLLEAGMGSYRSRYGGTQMPGQNTENLVRVTELCSGGCPANGNIPGLTYRSANWSSNINWNRQWSGAASFVTGSHSMKFGYQGANLTDERFNYNNNQFLSYRLNNGVADATFGQLTLTISEFPIRQHVRFDAFYGQEQWTTGRITFQGALRYDRAWSYFPQQEVGPVRFFPQQVIYPETKGVKGYNDLWPRGGAAIDVFGNGKTSVKVNFGRYLEAAQNGGLFTALNPTSRLSTTTTRTWNDANRNFIPDCDLLNITANGECGANANVNFGSQVFDSTLDPNLLSGWGVRSGDWQWGASVQQEVLPRVSVEFGYLRRWLVNFVVTDNRNRSAEDHTVFGVTMPTDPRLPNGGGGVLEGLYNVTAAAATRLTDQFTTIADDYGDYTQAADAINLNLTARPRAGFVLQGGFNTVNTHTDYCEVRSAIPEWTLPQFPAPGSSPLNAGPINPWCDTSTGWITRFTGLGTYTVPKIDVLLAGTFRSDQGAPLSAYWTAPNSATVGLNRPFAGLGSQTITVNLTEPGTLYGDRVNQFDMRFAKILRFGRTRTNVGFDVYNIMNAAPVLTYNLNFNPNIPDTAAGHWLTPTSVLQSRFVKLSAQIDF